MVFVTFCICTLDQGGYPNYRMLISVLAMPNVPVKDNACLEVLTMTRDPTFVVGFMQNGRHRRIRSGPKPLNAA